MSLKQDILLGFGIVLIALAVNISLQPIKEAVTVWTNNKQGELIPMKAKK